MFVRIFMYIYKQNLGNLHIFSISFVNNHSQVTNENYHQDPQMALLREPEATYFLYFAVQSVIYELN